MNTRGISDNNDFDGLAMQAGWPFFRGRRLRGGRPLERLSKSGLARRIMG